MPPLPSRFVATICSECDSDSSQRLAAGSEVPLRDGTVARPNYGTGEVRWPTALTALVVLPYLGLAECWITRGRASRPFSFKPS